MSKQLKIVHWNSATCWGGAEVRLLETCINLRKRGHKILVVCREKTPLFELLKKSNFDVISSAPRGSANILKAFLIGLKIKRWGANIIHAHAGRDYVPAIIAGMISHCPVIIHRHLLRPLNPITKKICKRWNTVFIGCSHKVAEVLIDVDGLDKNKVYALQNGIDPNRVECDASEIEKVKNSLNIRSRKVIVSVGHLYPSKGHDDLIKAVWFLKSMNIDPVLLIAGEGEEKNNLLTLVNKLGLTENVKLLGQRNDISALLHIADVFALLSWEDPFPGAMLEALACGKPVIGCLAGGVPEIIKDGNTGFLVPAHHPEAAAKALFRLLTDGKLCKSMGENAKNDFQERFSINRFIDNLENIYEKLARH